MLPSWILASTKNWLCSKRINTSLRWSAPLSYWKWKSGRYPFQWYLWSLYRKTSEHCWYICLMGLQCLPPWDTYRTLCRWPNRFRKDCAICTGIRSSHNKQEICQFNCSFRKIGTQKILWIVILLGSLEGIQICYRILRIHRYCRISSFYHVLNFDGRSWILADLKSEMPCFLISSWKWCAKYKIGRRAGENSARQAWSSELRNFGIPRHGSRVGCQRRPSGS